MHTAKIRKVGGSAMVAIPPAMMRELDLDPGTPVSVAVSDGRLVITPAPHPQRIGLTARLKLCDLSRAAREARQAADREWGNSGRAGREEI